MDSMRSLNTSLPSSHSGRPAPPEQLLQAFRTAALSVTNLYKSAVTDQSSSRQSGYQDAMEDLLAFLDRENLGLQDGEGWLVRQWATEKYDRDLAGPTNESDEEPAEMDNQRSTSPARSHNSVDEEASAALSARHSATPNPESRPENPIIQTEEVHPTPMYRFAAAPPTPDDTPMSTADNTSSSRPCEESPSSSDSPIRVEVLSRGSRTPHRHGGPRNSARSTQRDFTFTAGNKRKIQFPDFFDISNLGNGRDGSGAGGGGGAKRGRFA